MKILIFINSLGAGGAERVTINLSERWVESGHEVCIVTQGTEEDFYTVDKRVSRALIESGKNPQHVGRLGRAWASFQKFWSLRKLIKSTQPDVLVGIMTRASVLAILASVGLRCKVVVTEHNHPPMLSPGRLWESLRYLTYRYADVVVALAQESATWLKENCACKRVDVIPNAVIWPIPSGAPTVDPLKMYSPERRLLLGVGRLTAQKGFDYLIDAFNQISIDFPQWDLAILGEGPLRSDLETQIQKLGLTGRIRLPGRVGNVGDWYERADAYLLSSRFEGFSLTLAEAMASGLPSVSFDCDVGPRDIIDHGVSGLLVTPVESPDALARAIFELISNDKKRLRMAGRAIEVREKFSMDAVAMMWDETFRRIGVKNRQCLKQDASE